MKQIISFLSFLFTSTILIAQCNINDDYSTNLGWTQIGTNVEISNGKLNFLNGASDGQQRRVYKSIGATLDSSDIWSAEFDFTPTQVGNWGGPSTGHAIFALTAGNQEPFSNCPNIPCTGYPISSQDGIMVQYVTTNPTMSGHISNTIFFKLHAKDGSMEYRSPNILTGNSLNTAYYIKVERSAPTTLQLSVFSDSTRINHLPNSPVILTIPSSVEGLTTLQHGNVARGDSRRQLTGSIDNLCFSHNDTITSISSNDLLTTKELTIYPNPTRNTLTLKGLKGPFSLQLFNSNGQLVLNTQNKTSISLGHLPKGIYFLIVNEKEITYKKEVIIE